MRIVAFVLVVVALISWLLGARVARWMLRGGTIGGQRFTLREVQGFALLNVASWVVGAAALAWLAVTS